MTPPKRYFILFQCLSRQTIKWNASVPRWIRDLENGFQCLSRQTIKWNSADIGKLSQRTGVSMPQSANDQVELDYDTPETLFYIVSMPQSANDQVERECSQMDQGFGKWVSMPQSANDQVEPAFRQLLAELQPLGFNASVGKRSSGTIDFQPRRAPCPAFQCLSRQTIKWNLVAWVGPARPLGFNASVGKRSSGTL